LVKNATGISFELRVLRHETKEEENKVPVYRVVMEIVGLGEKRRRWNFVSEDRKVFNEFPLGQQFKLTAMFEQQQIA